MVSEQHPELWGDLDGRASWHLSVLESDTGRGQAAQQTPPGLASQRADSHTLTEAQGFPLALVHPVAGHTDILLRGLVAPARPTLISAQELASLGGGGLPRDSWRKPWLRGVPRWSLRDLLSSDLV